MPAHLVLLLSVTLLTASCGGGDKHLPPSNLVSRQQADSLKWISWPLPILSVEQMK